MKNVVSINVGIVIRYTLRKALVHKGFRLCFGGLVTKFCKDNAVEKYPFN